MPSGLFAACRCAPSPHAVAAPIRPVLSERRAPSRLRLVTGFGFSMIELMVVLVIATLLAVFTVPAYRDHMMRSRVPEATSGLLLTGMRLEQYFQDHRSYANAANTACAVTLPQTLQFGFDCKVAADGQSFLISANGRDDGVMSDFAYTLDHLGAQRTTALPTEWGNAPVNCWVEKRGAGC